MRVTETIDFLSLPEVKNYLRVEHTNDDDFLADLLEISKEQADFYLQNEFKEQNEAGEWIHISIPFSVKLACFKMIASWYETRSDDVTSINAGGVTTQLGQMPWDAVRLLAPYKRLVGL